MKAVNEGKARIEVAESSKISKARGVFYNPVMKHNRDISLLKGTVRAAIDADIDAIGELPAAGRLFNR